MALLVVEIEQWVFRLIPLYQGFRVNVRYGSVNIDGEEGLCAKEIVATHQLLRIQEVINERTNGVGNFGQDADNLTLFGILKLLEFVVGIENLGRLDENGLSSGGLVMYKSAQSAFELRRDGNAESAVADGHFGILLDDTVLFGSGENLADLAVGIAGDAVDGPFDVRQLVGGIVAHLPFVVHNAIDGGHEVALQRHLRTHRPESRVAVLLVAHLEIDENLGHRLHKTAQAGQFIQFDIGAVDAQPFQHLAKVVEILRWKGLVEEQQLAKLLHRLQRGHNQQHVGHELHMIDCFRALRTQTVSQNEPPHRIKTYFLLKILRVEHISLSYFFKMAAKVRIFGLDLVRHVYSFLIICYFFITAFIGLMNLSNSLKSSVMISAVPVISWLKVNSSPYVVTRFSGNSTSSI